MKHCSKCSSEKPLSDFYRNGKGSICKKCEYAQQKAYRLANPETCQKTKRKYQKQNIETLKLKSKQYRRDNIQKRLLTVVRCRAKQKGLPFNLELSDIIVPTFCPVLGIELKISETGKQCDNSPSIDRVVPSKGYTKGNVVVISNRANAIKNCGTIEEHEKVISYIKSHLTGQSLY